MRRFRNFLRAILSACFLLRTVLGYHNNRLVLQYAF